MTAGLGSEKICVIFAGGGKSKQSTTATTAANSTGWIDMRDWNRCLIVGVRVKGTGNITANTGVYVSTAATGSSPTALATIGVTHAVTGLLTAALGTNVKPGPGLIVLDVSQDLIARTLTNGRYISARLRKKTRADRISWIYVLLDPKTAKAATMTTGATHSSSTLA